MAVLARVDGIEASWLASGLDDAFALVAGRFFRREVRVRARACVAGMLSGLERKTGWSLAEYVGEKSTAGMQRLVTAARCDLDGVLIGDDTGFEKKGVCSAGVQRQYTGTAAKITNCQLERSLRSRRMRSAAPTLDPAATHLGSGSCEGYGESALRTSQLIVRVRFSSPA